MEGRPGEKLERGEESREGKRKEAGFSADNSSAQTSCEMLLASVFSSVRVVSNKEYFKCLTGLKNLLFQRLFEHN